MSNIASRGMKQGPSEMSKENFRKKDMLGNDLTVNGQYLKSSTRKTSRTIGGNELKVSRNRSSNSTHSKADTKKVETIL